jgi:hypothetical protein
MGAPAIVALQRSEREIVEYLRRHGATRADRATPLPDLRPIAQRRLRRLLNAEAVRETSDGFWLDEGIYESYRKDRRGLVLLVLGIAAVAILGALIGKLA